MAAFTYEAINAQGFELSGEIYAPDLGAAREQLRSRGLLPRRLVVADRRQPGRTAAAASGGVDDQVAAEALLDTGGIGQPHPGDAVPGGGGGQPDDLAPVQDLDGRQCLDAGVHLIFQEGPAGLADKGLCGTAREAEAMAGRGEAQLAEVPDHRDAPGD